MCSMKSRFLGTSVLQFLAVTIGVILLVINVVRGHLYCKKDRWVFSLRAEDEMATSGYQVGDILRSPDTLASCSTKCQMNSDCETFAFDKEDFKCQLINEPVLEDNDLVSYIANTEAKGYKVFQPDCGDGNKGGWWMLFKAGRGTGRAFHSDFDTDGAINTGMDVVHVKDVSNKALFHHPDLDTWGTDDPAKFVDVELRLFDNVGSEIFALRFDAIGTDKKTFFTSANLLYHPWTDNLFSPTLVYDYTEDALNGSPAAVNGSFAITDGAQGGWMIVLESAPAWDLVQIQPPAILYALPGAGKVTDWKEALIDGTAEIAGSFAIFVR
ncbi:uncharacterized protein LOC142340764 [Convolutriloba macropyga]|uniref:uncharacterized protein LOC142340764 n=1 Tax=Convolutriloba macropyga TaxID=536237 RepID=UPI003F522728